MKRRVFTFIILLFIFALGIASATDFGYNTLKNLNAFFGEVEFDGGWENGGCSIIDGEIYCQGGNFYNISSINITYQNLTIIDHLNVDGNITADYFFGNLIGGWNSSSLYVPYTGATSNLVLGANNFSVDGSVFFVDSNNNRVGIGTTNPTTKLSVVKDGATSETSVLSYSNVAGHRGKISLGHARGTEASPSKTLEGNALGEIDFQGYNGEFATGAKINAYATNDWADDPTDNPAYITISTTADGTALTAERMRIDEKGIQVKGAIVSNTTTITASSDNFSVSNINTLFVNASGGDVIIGGFTGGVLGQYLYVAITNHIGDVTMEYLEGVGDQDLIMHDSSDETLNNYGGWTFVCDGSRWYDLSHAKHV